MTLALQRRAARRISSSRQLLTVSRALTPSEPELKTVSFSVFPGLPKAAVITHLQSLKAAAGFWAFGATEDDVIYTPLPLYHSAASLIGIGGTIELGRLTNPNPNPQPNIRAAQHESESEWRSEG